MPFWGASRREQNAVKYENQGTPAQRRAVVRGRAREAARQREAKRIRADNAARARRTGSRWWS